MLQEQRQKEILNLLDEQNAISVQELCDRFETSKETIRRDLEALEGKGLLQRIRGGAMKLDGYTSFRTRKTSHISSKDEIAEEAVKHIREGQVIGLDSGTTSLALAREIQKKFHHLTVVTNSLAVVNELSKNQDLTLVVTGGVYKADEEAFVSDIAALILAKVNIDILFLTTCGISLTRGVTYQRMDEISIQERMMENAAETVVIADSSKLGTSSLVRMCGVEEISMIITDAKASDNQVDAFEKAGVRVVIAKEKDKEDE